MPTTHFIRALQKPCIYLLLLLSSLAYQHADAQQLRIRDFVLFGGDSTCPAGPGQQAPLFPGCGVNIGSSTSIQQGAVGSYRLVTSTGNSTINASIHSGGTVQLANSNVVTGSITAANRDSLSGNVVTIGSSLTLGGNLDAYGSILISGGTVSGKVTHPFGTTYTGPTPAGGNITGVPANPALPLMPAINTIPSIPTTAENITNNGTVLPNVLYGDLILTGNKTVTFNGSGNYVFRSIRNSGTTNKFVFDFGANNPNGVIRIFVEGDVDLNKVLASIRGDGSASRIFLETHGRGLTSATGTTAFNIANGSAGSTTKWLGAVWAPYGAITIGAGTGSSDLTGVLWSATQVNILSGVVVTYVPPVEDIVIVPFNPSTPFKNRTLIGAVLTSLTQSISDETRKLLVIIDGKVLINVIAQAGQQALVATYLASQNMSGYIPNGTNTLITTGFFPIANLLNLNTQGAIIRFCEPVYAPVSNSGVIQNAGDTAVGGHLVRNGFNLFGEGVKIGVISDSYNSLKTPTNDPAATDVSSGDLPGVGNPVNPTPVQVIADYPYYPRSDEGRAMLQLVHDIAPKATLAFRTGFISQGDLDVAVRQMLDSGCDVIVDDITFINEPFLKDGPVAKAIDYVKSQGATYFSSAGNFGRKSYSALYNPAPAPAGFVAGTTAHNFGNGDIYQKIKLKPGSYTIAFQWVDDIYSLGDTTEGGSDNDFDIYITNQNNEIICGYDIVNTGRDPFEFLAFTVNNTVAETEANILITRENTGTPNAVFKYVIFRGDAVIAEYNSGESTIVGHANAAGAIAVGAVNYFRTPAFNTPTPIIAPYSSIGGTPIAGVNRNKPDLSAPDGGNTSVNMGPDQPNDPDGFSNFFGTSAAAPNAAAVAALLIEGRQKYKHEVLTPAAVKTLMQSAALPFGNANASGAGLVRADSAMRTFAAPKPVIISLSYPSTVTPENTTGTFTLTVNGNYLTSNSVIYVRDEPVQTTFVNNQLVTTIINDLSGNPEIKVCTEALGFGDGGCSEILRFFDIPRKTIRVVADNKTKQYGQDLPAFTSTITVFNPKDGTTVPLSQSGLSLTEVGLQTLTYATNATALSNVGNQYFIKPVRAFDPDNAIDAALLEKYIYDTVPGILTIERLPVTVTPNGQTVPYGNNIGNVTFNYQFSSANMSNANAVMNVIKSSHETYLANNALAVISNGLTLTDAQLTNLSATASFQSIINARQFELSNDKLLPYVNGTNTFDINYIVDVAAQSVIDYRSNLASTNLVNAYPGINNRAMLNSVKLANGQSFVSTNGNLIQMVNATLIQMVNGNLGYQLPILNQQLVQMVNGKLLQYVNGAWSPVPNSQLVQMVNDKLVQFVNGVWVPISNDQLVQLVNDVLLKMVNGGLVQFVNGQDVAIVDGSQVVVSNQLLKYVNGTEVMPGSIVKLINGSLIQYVNQQLVQMVNGVSIPLDANVQIVNGLLKYVNATPQDPATNNTAVIVDAADVIQNNGFLGAMFSLNMITGLGAGQQTLVPGALQNSNLAVTYGLARINIQKAVINVKADNKTKRFNEVNPPLTYTMTGFAYGHDLAASGVTGTPALTTTAVQASPVGTYPITTAIGTLVASNYSFTFTNGTLTVVENPCLITHSPFNNFGNTTNAETSMWLNMETKISGQLSEDGDYLLFTGGSVTLNNITSRPMFNNYPMPNGKIIADRFTLTPVTNFDAATNTWITKIPVGYASTSDIFVSGVIMTSSNGFTRKKDYNTVVKGIFYSNKYFSDQWAFGLAAYQPKFDYLVIAGAGSVVSINGTYKAGTPLPVIANLVNGGSGGGGNYTGSSSNQEAFTACIPDASLIAARTTNGKPKAVSDEKVVSSLLVSPNPATYFADISFVQAVAGNSEIALMDINGKIISRMVNSSAKAGIAYTKKIDVSKLSPGVYFVQFRNGGQREIKKLVIAR